MHSPRFKKPSRYNSVLKVSALSVMVGVLSGCGKDSNNDSSSFLSTIWNKNNTAQVVLTGTAIDDPIFNGTVKVMTPDGVEIGKATTKVDGTFSVSVAESFLSAPILLQVSGGTMAGQPFTGTLEAIYTSQDGRTGLNLTPVTTLVSHLANAESGSDLAVKRNTVLNKLTALGMVDLQSWRKVKIGDDFSVRPSLVLNTDFKEFQTDFSFMAGYKDYVSLGFNVRGYNKKSFESLSPIISVGPLKNICIIYSYDVSLNKLNTVNKGSHEITLNYFLPNKKLYKTPKIINNPRFL